MNCIWRLEVDNGNIIEFDNEQDAIEYINKNSFSKDSLKKISTENYIDQVLKENKKKYFTDDPSVVDRKKNSSSEETFDKENNDTIGVTALITTPFTNEDGNVTRLVPEFIDENFENILLRDLILNQIFSIQSWGEFANINEDKNTLIKRWITENVFGPELITFENINTKLELIIKNLFEKYPDVLKIANFNAQWIKDVSKLILNEGQTEILSNFQVQLDGEYLHNLIYKIFSESFTYGKQGLIKQKDRIYDYMKNYFLEAYKEHPQFKKDFISKYLADIKTNTDLVESMIDAVYDARKQLIINHGDGKNKFKANVRIYPEIVLSTDLKNPINGKKTLKGKIDLLVVDGDSIYVYEFKTSKNVFDEWQHEKKLTTAYQGAFYSRILNNIGINTSKVHFKVIPFRRENGKIVCDKIEQMPVEYNPESTLIQRNLDRFLPRVNYSKVLNNNSFERVNYVLQKTMLDDHISPKTHKTNKKYIRANKQIVFQNKMGEFECTNQITGKKTTLSTENEVDQWIDKYIEELKATRPLVINRFVKALSEVIEGTHPRESSFKNFGKKDISFYECNFGRYCGQDKYQVLDYKELLDLGIVAVYDSDLHAIDLFIIEELDIFTLVEGESGESFKTIFDMLAWPGSNGARRIEQKAAQASLSVPEANRGNIALMKGLIVLNELDIFKDMRLGQIRTLSPGTKHSISWTPKEVKFVGGVLQEFVVYEDKKTPFEDNYTKIKTGQLEGQTKFVPISEYMYEIIKSIFKLNSVSETTQKKIEEASHLFEPNYTKSEYPKLAEKLLKLIEFLEASYSINRTQLNMQDPIHKIVAYLQNLYLYYNNGLLPFEEIPQSNLFGRGMNLLDSNMTQSLDTIKSQTIVQYRGLISSGMQEVRTKFTDFQQRMRKEQIVFEEATGYSAAEDLIIGAKGHIYQHMFQDKNENGEPEDDLVLKNPYDLTNDLSDAERRFAKFCIECWSGKTDGVEITRSDLLVPLVRARLSTQLTNGTFSFEQVWKKMAYNVQGYIKETFEERKEAQEEASNLMDEIVFEFKDRTDEDARRKLLTNPNYGAVAMETNLELVLQIYMLQKIKKKAFDKIIPTVRSLIYALSLQQMQTGLDMSKTIEYIFENAKSVIYMESLVPNEVRPLFKTLNFLRNVASTTALSWNFANLPREVLMGFWTNISHAMFKRYGSETFKLTHYMEALKYLIYDSPHFITEITKIELLNELYGLANMDLDSIVENTTSYKTGIIGGFSRFSGSALTAPDYWNRMSIFLAQMIHDGCFKAHFVKEDEHGVSRLIYDMAEDERFNVYYKYKDMTVPKNEEAVYKKQYGLYIAMLQEFNEERRQQGLSELKVGDKFTRAYTIRQRESIKSFADMSFGYYDLEAKSHWNKLWQGMLFKQFMTYLTAKKTQYSQSRTTIAAQGHFKPVLDKNGNQVYAKIIKDKDGYFIDVELTRENTGIDLHIWEGRVMEGIWQTYVRLFGDINTSIKTIMNKDSHLTQREIWHKYIESDSIESANLKASIYDFTISNLYATLLLSMFLDSPDEESYKKQIADLNWWTRTGLDLLKRSTQDLGILIAIQNGLWNWTPPAFEMSENLLKSFTSAFKIEDIDFGEKLLLGTVNSLGMFRLIRQDIENYITEK